MIVFFLGLLYEKRKFYSVFFNFYFWRINYYVYKRFSNLLSYFRNKFFFEVWPKNWFYAALVAFPTILFVRPISVKITNEVSNIIYK